MYIISEHRIFVFFFFLFGEVILGSDKIPFVPFFLCCVDLAQKMLQANESSAMYHLVKMSFEKNR